MLSSSACNKLLSIVRSTSTSHTSINSAVNDLALSLLQVAKGERAAEHMIEAHSRLLQLEMTPELDRRIAHWCESTMAFRTARRSAFSAQDFVELPGPSPLNDLSSFSVYGLDFKIDASDNVRLIEVNGINSGMSGFARSRTTAVDESQQLQRADHALEAHLRGYGSKHLAMIGTMLTVLYSTHHFRLPIVAEVGLELLKLQLGLNNSHATVEPAQQWFDDTMRFAVHLELLEKILDSKITTDIFLDFMREIKPKSYTYNEEGIAKFICNESDAQFAVVKPDRGARGKDIHIVPIQSLTDYKVELTQRYVIERFIESTPIYCDKTKDVHDGCMRVVALAERNLDGRLHFHHFGGYWRLCPLPLSAYGEIDAMRANLSQSAIPQQASDHHVLLAHEAAELAIEGIEISIADAIKHLRQER